jgi:hypothetical protein
MSTYIVRHPRTHMFLADKDANPRYPCYADAELPTIFLDLPNAEICPMLSCGLAGDPVSRGAAIANGTFHKPRAA